MKKSLSSLLLMLLCFGACKKDKTVPTVPVINPIQSNGELTITSIAPNTGLPNTVVTITGSNFGNTAADIIVLFNGVRATVQSVNPTEIKVLVPVTTTGTVGVVVGTKSVGGPIFTYIFPELNAAYTGGDVTLHNQAEIDQFVTLNKGKQLQIIGNLTIGETSPYSTTTSDISSMSGLAIINSVSGTLSINNVQANDIPFLNGLTAVDKISMYNCDLATLRLNGLRSFSGSLNLANMSQLNRIELLPSASVNSISISNSPLLTDISFLSNITSANTLTFSGLGISTINLDRLTTFSGTMSFTSNKSLSKLSCSALTTIPAGSLTISYSPLTDLNFKALKSMIGRLTLRSVYVTDMTGFSSLQNLGSLQLINNPEITSLKGLEQLTSLTATAIIANTILGSTPATRVNGIYISDNAKLGSLNGLQNVSNIPIAYIIDNPSLNNLCPFKAAINTLNPLPAYTYQYRNQIDQTVTATIAALTLTNNGSYTTKQAALDAVKLCP